MRSSLKWLALAVIAIGGAGCVSQVRFDQVNKLYKEKLEQGTSLQEQLAEKEREVNSLREAAAANDVRAELAKAIKERDELRTKLAEFETRLRNLGQLDNPLGEQLTGELEKLAQSNPELFTFDRKRGMIKLNSDLTFDSGSTTVKPEAAAAIRKLAAILNESIAARYEAMIVGHTDNMRISRPETRAQHPTNWHLSVHRAISVKDVLQSASVNPERMSVAGYGEYRPIVPNGPRGAEANRRVEIFLVPSTATGLSTNAAPEVAPPAAAPRTPAPTGPRPGDELYK
jgi:chemotaxis protein MotB